MQKQNIYNYIDFHSSFVYHGRHFFISESKENSKFVSKYTYEGKYMGGIFRGDQNMLLLGVDSLGQILVMD